MGKRAQISDAATVIYVAEMATELARIAGELQCTKLAYILEVAALEAKNTAQPPIELQGGVSALH